MSNPNYMERLPISTSVTLAMVSELQKRIEAQGSRIAYLEGLLVDVASVVLSPEELCAGGSAGRHSRLQEGTGLYPFFPSWKIAGTYSVVINGKSRLKPNPWPSHWCPTRQRPPRWEAAL